MFDGECREANWRYYPTDRHDKMSSSQNLDRKSIERSCAWIAFLKQPSFTRFETKFGRFRSAIRSHVRDQIPLPSTRKIDTY